MVLTMEQRNQYAGIDRFRIAAAFLVAAIHTAPLAALSATADLVFTQIIARIAVPFFLMVTGYFTLADYAAKGPAAKTPLLRFFKKTALLYGISVLLYLPVNWYAGHYAGSGGMLHFLKALFFEGTMYHLWYFPASMLGVALLYPLLLRLRLRTVTILTGILYLIGLLGDSYYGLIAELPVISSVYNVIFAVTGYTRNGLFFVPVFLLLGVLVRRHAAPLPPGKSAIGFGCSLAAMIAEGLAVHRFDLPRHDSMYLFLLPCMYFLFQLLLSAKGTTRLPLRRCALLIYVIHPMVIIAVRGAAKLTRQQGLLVENNLMHYLLVCLASLGFAVVAAWLTGQHKKTPGAMGRAWTQGNLQHLRRNAAELQRILPADCAIMAVVKADAYGHGAVRVARELNSMGIKAFCTATAAEGIALRKGGVKGEILVLGFTHPSDFDMLRRYHLTQTVLDYDYAMRLNDYGKPLKVHIKIDTGLHRTGEWAENTEKIAAIFRCKHLRIEGIYTHLSAPDSTEAEDIAFTQQQIARFYAVLADLEARGIPCPKTHIQSSYGVLNYPDLRCDYARIGIALYGAVDESRLIRPIDLDLRPVLSVHARTALVRDVAAGEAIGYGLQYTAEHDMKLAVLSIGYADGIPRRLSETIAWVAINGRKAPVIGVCMDSLLADVTGIDIIPARDTAVILGGTHPAALSAVQIASFAGTIPNEILSCLGKRLERNF